MEFEQTQCKESLISHDYSRKTLAEDRGWYFQLHLYPPTNCTSRNYTKSSAQSLRSWRFTSQRMELIRSWLQAMAYNSSLLNSNSNTAQPLPITSKLYADHTIREPAQRSCLIWYDLKTVSPFLDWFLSSGTVCRLILVMLYSYSCYYPFLYFNSFLVF